MNTLKLLARIHFSKYILNKLKHEYIAHKYTPSPRLLAPFEPVCGKEGGRRRLELVLVGHNADIH
jgi:hypothetical protein